MTVLAENIDRSLDARSLDVLFRQARSAKGFQPTPIAPSILQDLIELTSLAPTALNAQPLRVLFVNSDEARERLKPLLWPGNVEKAASAPVTAILARDLNFHEHLPRVFPQVPPQYLDNAKAAADPMSLQNATLQAGYFILAARALGLDVGPMGGFDSAGVDAEFFPDGSRKSILLVMLGYGDDSKLFPRNPRLDFAEIATII
jgi:3-hydroxypropanoate dehydrogenase